LEAEQRKTSATINLPIIIAVRLPGHRSFEAVRLERFCLRGLRAVSCSIGLPTIFIFSASSESGRSAHLLSAAVLFVDAKPPGRRVDDERQVALEREQRHPLVDHDGQHCSTVKSQRETVARASRRQKLETAK